MPDDHLLPRGGRSGRGKTHFATAVAYRAIPNGFDALFTTAAALIDDLAQADAENRLQQALRADIEPDVLVVDEFGNLARPPRRQHSL